MLCQKIKETGKNFFEIEKTDKYIFFNNLKRVQDQFAWLHADASIWQHDDGS